MKTIYLVRHGEAENNMQPSIYIGDDGALTGHGRQQAQFIAQRAMHLKLDALVASTFTRAQETAVIIAKATGLTVESSDLFVERKNPTQLVGREWSDPETQRIEKAWVESLFVDDARIADGENYGDIHERGRQSLTFLENHAASNILVVTHGFYLRMLIAQIMFGDALTPGIFKRFQWTLRTRNTGLTVLKYDENDEHAKWWISVWNDHAHLG